MEKPKSRRVTMNINGRLPLHIIQVIFSKLPIVHLPSCRLVCKSWNDLILNHACKITSKTFFLCMYGIPKIHCVDFDPKHLGGMSYVASVVFQEGDWSFTLISNSCNGLLFFFKINNMSYNACAGIFNPMTSEYFKLPGGNNSYEDDEAFYGRTHDSYAYGFGFSPKTKRYKVARAFHDKKNPSGTTFDIFTFDGCNQWRSVDSVPFVICREGVYFNGAIYWIGMDQKNWYENFICRLDVEKEKVETIISLSEVGSTKEVSIQAFNDSVYATFFFMYPCYKIEVWRLMQSYGKEDSWMREFVINDFPIHWVLPSRLTVYLDLIKAYEDGEIFCLVNQKSFILYNPKTGKIKTLNQFEQHRKFARVCQVDSFFFGSLQKILAGDDG